MAGELKLVEELAGLREQWGEGFDEDVAQPLARMVKTLRQQHAAMLRAHSRELSGFEERIDSLESELEAKDDIPPELAEELRDCTRGIRTIEEVFDKWLPT